MALGQTAAEIWIKHPDIYGHKVHWEPRRQHRPVWRINTINACVCQPARALLNGALSKPGGFCCLKVKFGFLLRAVKQGQFGLCLASRRSHCWEEGGFGSLSGTGHDWNTAVPQAQHWEIHLIVSGFSPPLPW